MYEIYIEKWLTYTLIDGKWDVQLSADSAKPLSANVYRLKVKVPAELIGEVTAEVSQASSAVLQAFVGRAECADGLDKGLS